MIFLLVFFLTFVFWLYAEKKLGVNARVGAGVACMVFIGFGF
jgi:hypothetical protein